MDGLRRLTLILTGLVIFLHGISLYALPVAADHHLEDTEMTEETSEQSAHIYAFDAVVPVVQYISPHIWHYLGEVVVLTVAEFPHYTHLEAIPGSFFDLLFPHIISPNAP